MILENFKNKYTVLLAVQSTRFSSHVCQCTMITMSSGLRVGHAGWMRSLRGGRGTREWSVNGSELVWNTVISLWEDDVDSGPLRQMPKLTRTHVHPRGSEKMRVNAATQMYSVRSSMLLILGIRDTVRIIIKKHQDQVPLKTITSG